MNNEYKTIAGTDYPIKGQGIKKNYELVKNMNNNWKKMKEDLREEFEDLFPKDQEAIDGIRPSLSHRSEALVLWAKWEMILKEALSNQLQETSLDQYAMGQREGMDYHEFKMKELKEKVEKMNKLIPYNKYKPETEEEAYNIAGRVGYNQALTDILNLLSSK